MLFLGAIIWRGKTTNLEYILRSYESPKNLLNHLLNYIEQTIKFHLFDDFKVESTLIETSDTMLESFFQRLKNRFKYNEFELYLKKLWDFKF
jgi:hypothetical protein